MLYYRIKDGIDDAFTGKTTVFAGELFTLKEMKKNGIPLEWAEVVSIAPQNTYFFFGSRRGYPAGKLQELTKEQYEHSSNPELRKIARGE